MGNSESQYSIQGPKGTDFVPGKPKPYSLKLRTAKDDALSPHTWWKSAPVSSGYKARCVGRGCLSPPKSRPPYSPRHCDYVSKGTRGSPSEHRWHQSPGCGIRRRHISDEYENNPYGTDLNGRTLNGHSDEQEALEEQSSPRVVIKKDGSLRVEFTNTSGNALLLDEASGPVQLLKFSPNMESTSIPSLPGSSGSRQDGHRGGPPPASTSSTARTSKGSSLSSDGSWYDSPWGPSTELCEQDQPCSSSRTLVHSSVHQLDAFTEQSPPVSITDLYKDSTMAATFPTAKDLSSHLQQPPPGQRPHRASFASVLDAPLEEESPEACQYSSYTLPCRRPKAHTMSEDLDQYPEQEQAGSDFGIHKKDSIKNRMRRFSDWTGSLSRKKRKSQETRYKDLSDAFDSGVDGLTADTSSPSQVSSTLWFPGASRAQSSGAIHQTANDLLRQNIYENFMRELETGTGQGGGERSEIRDPSTGTEEGESSSESAEGSLEQLDRLFEKEQGVVRRAGWLSFKPLVTLHKDRKLELVTRRKWKQYWVTLKGCTLLFYETYSKGSPEHELSPRYALLAEDSIVQAVPEHPKKENVFCLSNSYGDVYLFQASNQTDLENWVTAIHSASASLLAKRQGKEDTVRLLRSQVRGLLQKIDMDGKMKKMAELQLTVVSDPKNRKAIENQIQQWEQNLERFNLDLFRMRCYLASLQGGELPNPKSLLAIASRPTKSALGRLGIFSVSSFHALICSRDEATLRRRSVSLTHRQRKRGLFSSLKGLDNLTKRGRDKRPSASQIFESDAGGQTYALPPRSTERLDMLTSIYSMSPPEGGVWDGISGATDVLTCVYMPDGLTVQVPVRREQTAADLLSAACKVKQLDAGLHCLRLHRRAGQGVEVRHVAPGELLADVVNDQLEVVPVNVFTLHMSRPSETADFGFAVTGHIDSQKNSRIFVSEVLPDDLAFNEGLRPGDEILVLNGRCVSSLDLTLIQTLFAEQTLHLSLRRDGPSPPTVASNHRFLPLKHNLEVRSKHHRAKSSSDVCTAADCAESLCVGLENGHSHCAHRPVQHSKSVDTVCTLYQSFQEGAASVSGGLMDDTKGPQVRQGGELGSGHTQEATLLRPCPKLMSATERLRKVIQELVDTEKSYVKDLACLFEIYLKPLQNETFLTLDEMESLFGSLPEMLDFQRVFLQTLEERIASSPDFSTLETPSQFKKLLFSLGGSFLYYADHFKLYSGFCANHIKVQKVMERAKTDQAFKEFLDARNPTKQHSSTLESYLIKPVQRVLKYPLLLRELVSLTDADSEEHYHLTEALKAMEKVASHINEMQKIYEDYGSVFDQLVAEQTGHDKEVTEISMGEFLMHSSVVWLNPHTSLGRMRKDPEMTVFVFKKAVILVYRENNKLKKKMTSSRSALSHGDSDPFKFRWLIPLSALQVRLGNTAGTGTETSCIWELIHSRSEVEGRPETIFQLCSSVPENKVNIIKVIRSILRENVRRNMRSEGTLEKSCKERLVPLRSTLPSSARIGSTRASWLCKQPLGDLSAQAGNPKLGPDSDEGSLSSGTYSLCGGAPPPCTSSELHNIPVQPNWSQTPGSNSQPRSTSAVKESDILSDEDDDGFIEGGTRRGSGDSSSPTSAIEAQFLQLKLSEDAAQAPCVQPEGDTPETQPKLMREHFNAVKRKTSSFRRSQGALLNMKAHSKSLDSQADATSLSGVVDLNALLEREFSVQSLTSVVNEDCFYEPAESCATNSGNSTSS
ncbi:LOW QUALITY PROTEIN: T-lymphoma invasion and metastasis-inducing protein 2 [Cottoperca gobio]|uniref:LOW QUALITY PROTEIN: T-lymphoma invasion and metastasis-inducing protein 2 n=1 Tax=Cottoperca gobio TaxID=56716 RepID=A0A6J2RYI4_COTGO|nr:LOW QUALITY PROTEIN: T-lymphoma invasion and metastasis-inducing protein 2 [Cottoperca gobio]